MAHYEVEVKSLLGEELNATALKEKMCALDPACACVSTNKQLNHYFKDGDINELYAKTQSLFSDKQKEKFKSIVEKGTNFSVRTRQMAKASMNGSSPDGTFRDDEVLLVVKASVDEGTSANTVTRLEFEEPVRVALKELDALVESAGFTYQAKWSREREEYSYKGANVCFDKNAGYGYLAEFEKVVEDDTLLAEARKNIEELMEELGVVELPQDRLERMFTHYNENWPEYYGTDKTFIIE